MLCKGVRAGRFHERPGQGAWCIPGTHGPRGPDPTCKLGWGWMWFEGEREGLKEHQMRLLRWGDSVVPHSLGTCRYLQATVPTPELGAPCRPVRCQPRAHTTAGSTADSSFGINPCAKRQGAGGHEGSAKGQHAFLHGVPLLCVAYFILPPLWSSWSLFPT